MTRTIDYVIRIMTATLTLDPRTRPAKGETWKEGAKEE